MTEQPDQATRALGSRYELIGCIGQGASGVVWRAWDRRDQKPVAAKLLWPYHIHDEEILTRFIRERAILTGLRHPNIVNVTDLVAEGDDVAIIMDLVPGPSLSEVLCRNGPLAPADAAAYVAVVLDALAHAHENGVLHRDVKTDNILLAADPPQPSDVRLADFGIARLTQSAGGTERIGTPHYMAPELLAYGRSGPATDVYAAGIVLYELIAGRTPFAGEGTEITVSLRHLNNSPPPLAVPYELWSVLKAMLIKDPAQRPTTTQAAEILRNLADLPRQPLPAQPDPEHWEIAPDTLPDKQTLEASLGYTSTVETYGDDAGPEATGLRAKQSLRAGAADESVGALLEPGGQTYLKADPARLSQTRSARPERALKNKRAPLLVGVGVGAVVVIAVLALWLAGVFHGVRPPVSTAAAHLTGDNLPTGLRVDLDAAYDANRETTVLTVTLAASTSSGLSGDILIDVPGLTGTPCPEVTAPRPLTIQRLKASADGFTGTCAHKLTGASLEPGQTQLIPLTVDLDMWVDNRPPPASYSQWLDTVKRTTDDDLRAITGTGYPLQRVTGLSVQVDSVTLDPNMTVPYSVYPQWISPATAPTQALSHNTITGMETSLLLSLTGGVGLSAVTIDTCDAVQKVGIRLLPRQPDNNCSLSVRIGNLTTPSTPFSITMR